MDPISSIRDTVYLNLAPIRLTGSSNDSLIISIISLTIGILAVFFGPLIQLRISKRSMNKQFSMFQESLKHQIALFEHKFNNELSQNNRQNWINTLRKDVASLVTAMHETKEVINSQRENVSRSGGDSKGGDDIQKYLNNIFHLKTRIKLLFNPLENDYTDLLEKIELAAQCLRELETANLNEHLNCIILETQSIIKTEWEKIKTQGINIDFN